MTNDGAEWATLIFMAIIIVYGICLAIKEAIFGPPKPISWTDEEWDEWKKENRKKENRNHD